MQSFDQEGRSATRAIKLDPRVARSTLAVCLLAAAGLVGAREGCSTPDTIHRPYTFTYVKSGGFAGVHEKLVVDSIDKRLTYQSKTGEFQIADATESDLLALEAKLSQADFMSIQKPYRCTGCADQFVHEATLQMADVEEHKVHWEDGSGAPLELTDIGMFSESLVRERFITIPPSQWIPAAAAAR
jgi:hypothetical protein